MKIGVVIDQVSKGGVSNLAVREVQELIRQGHNAELVILRKQKKDRTYEDLLSKIPVRNILDEIPIFFKINFKIPFFSFFSFFHILSFFYFPLVIKKKEYDFFIIHSSFTCFAGLGTKWFRKIPYMAYIHDSIYYVINKAYISTTKNIIKKAVFSVVQGIGFWVDRLIGTNALGIAKQARFEVDYFKEKHHITNIKIVTSTTHDRIASPKNKAGKYFLAYTKWDFTKNFELLIKILEELKDFELVVAGFWHPADYELKIKSVLKTKGLMDRVKFLGTIPYEDIPKMYEDAIALIHPLMEAWGASIYESACNSTPFIAVQGSGIQDYMTDGVDGFFIPQNDLQGFIDKIKLFQSDEGLALKMGRSAWENIKKIDLENHVHLLLKIYQNKIL